MSLQTTLGILLLSICLCSHGERVFSQEEYLDSLESSAIVSISDEIGKLIRLTLIDGKLQLQRDWQLRSDRLNANETEEMRKEREIKRLIDRGVPRERAIQSVEGASRFKRMNYHDGIMKLFSELREEVGPTSMSGGGSKARQKMLFSNNEIKGAMFKIGENVRLEFGDTAVGGTSFMIQDSPGGMFHLRIVSDDFFIDLRQKPEKTRLILILGDAAEVMSASNYESLVLNHGERIHKLLMGVVNQFGIESPLSFADEKVLETAIECLNATEKDREKVEQLVNELEADSFQSRDAAMEELMRGYYKWYALFGVAVMDREFGDEAQQRVDRISKGSPGDRVKDFVLIHDISNAPESLIRLMDVAKLDDRPLVQRRLTAITGKDFGTDINEWRAWLKNSKELPDKEEQEK